MKATEEQHNRVSCSIVVYKRANSTASGVNQAICNQLNYTRYGKCIVSHRLPWALAKMSNNGGLCTSDKRSRARTPRPGNNNKHNSCNAMRGSASMFNSDFVSDKVFQLGRLESMLMDKDRRVLLQTMLLSLTSAHLPKFLLNVQLLF